MFLTVSSATSMSEAVANTLMGMSIVFLVLIFIALIISLFKYISKFQEMFSKKTVEEPVKQPVAPVEKAPAPADNLMNDAQLVAVITAAIHAAAASNGAVSKDTLVVRSIRRAK